ncbi:MAG: cell division protein FtsQ/DivIB, partial [Gammaproteobacteria bacterium]|nr:cell division protein FtsQ/DivIB [Gammaproteobacteria bacterium]
MLVIKGAQRRSALAKQKAAAPPPPPEATLNRLNNWMIVLLVVCVATAVLITLVRVGKLNYPVRSVRVDTPLYYLNQQELMSSVGKEAAHGFLAANLGRMQESIEALAWVKKVSIRRSWPDRLIIRIEEQQPVALWGDKALVNQEGELFYPSNPQRYGKGLPRLIGPDESSTKVLQTYLQIRSYFQLVSTDIDTLILTDRRAWEVVRPGGMKLLLGREK